MEPSDHQFLEGFTPVGRQQLLQSVTRENYRDGAYLFREGDAADGVYLLLEGRVEILRTAGCGEKMLHSILPNDYFGEVAVLDGGGRSTSARASGTTSIAKISGATLIEVLSAGPGTATLNLFQHVLPQLRRATDQVVREVVHREKLSLVGEMANSLMHDLRGPVSNIRLSADLIEGTSREKEISKWCDGIRLHCDRLVGMTAELMDFSKGESHLSLTRTTTIDFIELFKSLNEIYFVQSGIEINFDSQEGVIVIDILRVQRLLQNLITNAVEALCKTHHPVIEVKSWVNDSTFHLKVHDNGPGIPSAIRNQIFEPFVTSGKSKGIGLGMAIVRNIVTAHGGSISFESQPDQGTSFVVSLPQKAIP
jgi:signal transduction histidine kinase